MKTKTCLVHHLTGDHDVDLFDNSMSEIHNEFLKNCYHQGKCDDDCEIASRYFTVDNYNQAIEYLLDLGVPYDSLVDSQGRKNKAVILKCYLWVLSGSRKDLIDFSYCAEV